MAEHNHAVVWIDHHEARVFHFNAGDVEAMAIQPDDANVHIHHKANSIGSGHAAEDQAFLHAVVEAFGSSNAILVTGPGSAKTELMKHIQAHDPAVAGRVAGLETVDHPSAGELVNHARAYFRAADRLTARK